MSSQELSQVQQGDSNPSEEAAPSVAMNTEEADDKKEAENAHLAHQAVPPAQPSQQEVPSSEPAVPSSDAVLPSSPSPVKQLPNTMTSSTAANIPQKRPAENIEPTPTETTAANPTPTPLQQKLTNLQAHLTSLRSLHAQTITNSTLPSGLPLPKTWTPEEKHASALSTANAVIKEHIALLHSYNEIKDVGMGLLGLVAEKRGCRVRVVMEEYGMGEKD